ncbi:MAG TPA: DUF4124 domain-containing protein [Cellvibrionaceae bacterium]
MWRYLFKLLVFLVLIAGVGNYFIYFTTGRIPLQELWHHYRSTPVNIPKPTLPTLDLPRLPSIPGVSKNSAPKAFKWTDANGGVHYSDQAPDGQNAKLINMDPNQNLVQGSPASSPSEPKSPKQKTLENSTSEQKIPSSGENKQIDMGAIQKILQGMRSAADQQKPVE